MVLKTEPIAKLKKLRLCIHIGVINKLDSSFFKVEIIDQNQKQSPKATCYALQLA